MRVTLVNFHADSGGAGIAALRLIAALREHTDVEARYAVVDPGRCRFARTIASPLRRKIMRLQASGLYRFDRQLHGDFFGGRLYNFFSNQLLDAILSDNPDVVHLHSVTGEMLSLAEIGELARKVPVVWTLHDMWPFCGCEQYALDEKFVSGYPGRKLWDLDARSFRSKLRHWQGVEFQLIAPSKFMQSCAQKSLLFQHQKIRCIGNTLDTRIFSPGFREEARAFFGISPDRPVVAVGCDDPGNVNKSFYLAPLLRELERLAPRTLLLVAGKRRLSTTLETRCPKRLIGDAMLARFYRAADFFCLTSRIDNLPNMALEALACGTPVAAVPVGGVGDLVTPETGIIAADGAELGERLAAALAAPDPHKREVARSFVQEHFSPEIIARRHAELYHDLTR